MEIKELETFLAVVAEQSLNKAAEALFLSQSTVTMRIKSLEEKVGCPLFTRTSRGVQLTEQGRLLVPYAERIRRNVEESYHLLATVNAGSKRLAIGAASAIGSYQLPYILGRYVEAQPDVEILCRNGKSNDIFQMLLDEEVQIGMTGAPIHHAALECHALKSDPVHLLTAPEHRLAVQGRAELFDLEAEPFISFAGNSPFWKRIDGELVQYGVRVRRQIEMDSIEGIKRIVMQGIGVTLLPASTVREEVAKQQLVQIPMPIFLERPTYLLHRKQVLEEYEERFLRTCVDFFASL
ncbi:LysR family transcriptional regulator [Tumebacillus flagellatus]|uniref:LysR family transcriptional regulator n=1 Tax=Tumebacillus flagellatus TaxID=1157490 RepID=UPI001377C238|nr:LysR family transcriptional regulator [Tumebacillus flagellatus]